MIRSITPVSLIVLSLSIAFMTCTNDNKFKNKSHNTVESKNYDQQILPEPNKNHIDSMFDYEINKKRFSKIENNYHVHGTDEDGNKVTGTITMDGKAGIGMLRSYEAKGIEIVGERTSRKALLATDVHGYEYQLKLDDY
ncbi:hypothetical protein [Flavobacterium frigoris]|uniref:Uncharacterized protein n=1 Tax=Flavobacterium frigoris (strain PS1) TaxID=1086011 RepID=H7FLG1_FLAFP|nr:hypothetical protein [Flavobacterium frigoris]EIA10503.1 hypothetical protein HJ01_00009 [Flavobacterium frigoris PS1]